MVEVKGGDALRKRLQEIAANLDKGAEVEVGFMEDKTYPDGTRVALVAALNEFGVPSHNQPPRPFFRNAIAVNQDKWPVNIVTALKANNYDAEKALALVGEEIQGEIQESILELTEPALAESTIAGKSRGGVSKIAGVMGPEKPLIASGLMYNSVVYRVES